MTKCSTLVPAIRQSGFIISVIYKTYTLKDISALSKHVPSYPHSPAPQGDSNYSCAPRKCSQFGVRTSGWQKCECKWHSEQRSWEVPALVSAGPGLEVSDNQALSQAPRRIGHRQVRQQCTEQTRGGRRSQI